MTLGSNGKVLFRLVNNPEEIGSLGRLGLLEVATQFDVAPGRGCVWEQGNMVSSWLVVEYWEILFIICIRRNPD